MTIKVEFIRYGRSGINGVANGNRRRIGKRRRELEQQLKELGRAVDGAARDGRRGTSPLAGRRVAAKYRGPGGELWAGRGQKPNGLLRL
jgi:hypothetical protein